MNPHATSADDNTINVVDELDRTLPLAEHALNVSEIFGPTFQGEGPSIGRRCMFLRLGGCNLSCVWCDTPYTWDWTGKNGVKYDPKKEIRKLSAVEVYSELVALGIRDTDTLVISGGEPMLQRARLETFILGLPTSTRIEIETAGTITPSEILFKRVDQWNISPKLAHSGNPAEKRYKPMVLNSFYNRTNVAYKFVVIEEGDLSQIEALQDAHHIPSGQIWVMPEGKTADALTNHLSRDLAAAVLTKGWNLTTRLHVQLWGDVRGV